jgi:hypothetical protein
MPLLNSSFSKHRRWAIAGLNDGCLSEIALASGAMIRTCLLKLGFSGVQANRPSRRLGLLRTPSGSLHRHQCRTYGISLPIRTNNSEPSSRHHCCQLWIGHFPFFAIFAIFAIFAPIFNTLARFCYRFKKCGKRRTFLQYTTSDVGRFARRRSRSFG